MVAAIQNLVIEQGIIHWILLLQNNASSSLPEMLVHLAPATMQGTTPQIKVFYGFHIFLEQAEFEVMQEKMWIYLKDLFQREI